MKQIEQAAATVKDALRSIHRGKMPVTLLIVVATSLLISAGATLAYVQVRTQTAQNITNAAGMGVQIVENDHIGFGLNNKQVTVENTNTMPAYVRVRITPPQQATATDGTSYVAYNTSSNDDKLTVDDEYQVLTYGDYKLYFSSDNVGAEGSSGKDWVYVGNGLFYYTQVLNAKSATSQLLNGVVYKDEKGNDANESGKRPSFAQIEVDVVAEALPTATEKVGNRISAWSEDNVEVQQDGTLAISSVTGAP